MLDTLLKLGEQLSQNVSKWDDYLEKREKKLIPKGEKELYILNIVFDIDNKEIIISPDNLSEFDKELSVKKHWLFQTFAARAGKTYVATLFDKTDDLKVSLFGKDNESKGQFQNDIDNKFPKLKTTHFYKAIKSVYSLIDKSEVLNKSEIISKLNINRNQAITFCYISIRNSELGINEPTELSKLDGFSAYFEKKFFGSSKKKGRSKKSKLCYVSDDIKDDVDTAKYNNRRSINAMFVQTTWNYAASFDKKNFAKNYQLSNEANIFIERGSDFLIENYTVRIAGVEHMIIPQFLSKTEIDFEYALNKIHPKSDFLFKYKELQNLDTDITDELDNELYWLNFLAIDSDGKYFKTTNIIKDVSKPYFLKLLETFDKVNSHFYNYLNSKVLFNFYSIYRYIPVNSDLKKNEALILFKDILEHKEIDKNILFDFFLKYLICQRSGQFDNKKRHRAYDNIRDSGNLDYAIKNAVFHYLAFIQVLKELNLIKSKSMDENTEILKPAEEELSSKSFGERIENFFIKMGYNETQKALFYLGRVLSQVAYAQYKKKHESKPVLNKINYNGMDKDDIIRLRVDLAEKARQYNIVNKVEYNFSNFTDLYNPNDKSKFLSSAENVFFILSGYSFGMIREENNDENKSKK